MRKIAEVAARENAGRVTAVRVWLGALSHMSAQHFREHFDNAAAGGIAEGARLRTDISTDIEHPDAQRVILVSVDVEPGR
ncbi:hypothetical protein [Constrictibacter sp. MBR-5]|uniref:hypothetical protein n=1 Tax=Constrictibacter sp. MBR-5 TaxID=3156467 RepID=UPI003390D5C2